MGNLTAADKHLTDAIELFNRRSMRARDGNAFAHNPGRTAPATLSHIRWSLGFSDQATRLVEGALQAVDSETEVNTTYYIMYWSGLLRLLLRMHQEAFDVSERLEQFTKERGSKFWLASALPVKGAALVELGELQTGLDLLLSPLVMDAQAMGDRQHDPFLFCFEVRAYLRLGRTKDCEARLDATQACLNDTNQMFYAPGVYLTAAEVLSAQGKQMESEASLHLALRVAQQQGSKSWALRASLALTKMFLYQGRKNEARAALEPIYSGFTEGFETPDLVEAKSVLNRLD
jgi:predicted ATPase